MERLAEGRDPTHRPVAMRMEKLEGAHGAGAGCRSCPIPVHDAHHRMPWLALAGTGGDRRAGRRSESRVAVQRTSLPPYEPKSQSESDFAVGARQGPGSGQGSRLSMEDM
jgi:hypothetical protein